MSIHALLTCTLALFTGIGGFAFGTWLARARAPRQKRPIPGQWWKLDGIGAVFVEKLDGSTIGYRTLSQAKHILDVSEFLANGRLTVAPHVPVPGSIWTTPEMGRVVIIKGIDYQGRVTYRAVNDENAKRWPSLHAAELPVEQFLEIATLLERERAEA